MWRHSHLAVPRRRVPPRFSSAVLQRCCLPWLTHAADSGKAAKRGVSGSGVPAMEMYDTQNATALSPTLTSSHLLIASALTVQRRGNVPGGRTMLDLSHGHLALLTRADAASLTSLVALTDATPPHCQCVWCFPGCAPWRGKRGAAVGVRLLKTWAPCALVSRRPKRRTSPVSPATPTSSES